MRYAALQVEGKPRIGVVDATSVTLYDQRVSSIESLIANPEPRPGDSAEVIDLAHAEFMAPLRPRKNIFCVGRNYLAHAEETTRAQGIALELPDLPTFFTKAPTAIVAPGAIMQLSAGISRKYDWEAELAVVIGTRCKDISQAQAQSAIYGYCCFNDVSARDIQQAHVQWFKGKSLDGTAPLGPWIVTADEIPDPQQLTIELRINGIRKQRGSTSQMIFSVARIIAELSRGMTLEPGDIIATGTPDGVGFARNPPEYLQDGDTIEVEIERLGVLCNTVALR